MDREQRGTSVGPRSDGRSSAIPVAREGWPFILVPLILALVLFGIGRWGLALGLSLIALAAAAFFRDPQRQAPSDPDLVLAPADGRVTRVASGPEGLEISIFLSVFDVHVNRSPVAGDVLRVRYLPGRFLAANFDHSSIHNERNELQLSTPRGPVSVTQIAGLIARRIICRAQPGDELGRGERFGLIRFGSRTDLRLPPGAEPLIAVGEKTRGGETAVARWSKAAE